MPASQAPRIRFTFNPQKAVEAILWIIKRGEPNIYNILKIFYEADKYHLNKYTRPVTGDNYVAMQFGTVPSAIYDLTKNPPEKTGFTKHGNRLKADNGRTVYLGLFSKSDIEALEHGFVQYAGLGFKAVVQKNHKENAWIKAVERTPKQAEVSPILFEDMIDSDKKWLVEDLQELGHCISI